MISDKNNSVTLEEYQLTKNKNLFEEVIDKMMLESFTSEFSSKIMSMPLKDKRMSILSLLDKDRNLFLGIKGLINSGIGKYEHIKDVVLMLREYVKVGEVEKKKFGEVMTPLELVKEMLATLPEEVWSNPNLKWLDPANGTGPYPLMVIYRLMNGLKDWEPDEEKRYKHIVEKMIYVCELQPKNMFLYMCAVDPWDMYQLNIYTGSFLEEGFDKHMKEVWGFDKFDIVVGNPPYNDMVTSSGSSIDIYDKFIFKSYPISNNILMITPSKWFNKADKKELRNLLIGSGILQKIKISNYFEDLNIRGGVSYFLTENNKNNDYVLFDDNFVDLKKQINSFDLIFTDQNESKLLESLLDKLSKYNKLSTLFNSAGYFGLNTNHKEVYNIGTKCYFSSRQKNLLSLKLNENGKYYSYVKSFSDNKSKLNRWKLMTPKAYGFKTKVANTYNEIGELFIASPGEICTQTYCFFDLNSKEECLSLETYLKTNFIKYLIKIRKVKQDVTSKIFDLIPIVPFDREWTDEILFEYFGLTDEEKKLIK